MKIFIKKHLWFTSFAVMALCSLHVVGMEEHKEPASIKHKKAHPVKIIIETPEQLMQIIVNLLDDEYNAADIESRILDTASILYKNQKLLLLRDEHKNTAFEILHEAFDRFYDIQHRKNHYKIAPKNNYLGLSWVLELATTQQLTLQSLYNLINIDAQNPEKMIHIIQYFLDHGTSQEKLKKCFSEHDIEIEDSCREADGITSLMLAAYNGFDTIYSFLLEANALVTTTDKRKNTALHYAAERGDTKIVELLCKHEAENGINIDGLRPSKRVLQHSNERPNDSLNMLEAILKHSIIDDEIKDTADEIYFSLTALCQEHLTPDLVVNILSYVTLLYNPTIRLNFAAGHGYHPIIRFLKKANCDFNVARQGEQSPLFYAASNGQASTVELLSKFGAQDIIPNPDKAPTSTYVQEHALEYDIHQNLRILWSLLSTQVHPKQQIITQNIEDSSFTLMLHLYFTLIEHLRNHVSTATAALILQYINPVFDSTLYPRLGQYSRFIIHPYLAQNPYQIYATISTLIAPEDQSVVILDAIGNWLDATAQTAHTASHNTFNIDIADTDGTTAFDLAIRQGSYQIARILAAARSRPNSIQALHTLLDHLRYHYQENPIAQMRILKVIAILSGISVNNIDTANYHNNFIMPLASRFLPLIDNNNHQSLNELVHPMDELDHDLTTALEVRAAIPELQTIAAPLLAIIMSYYMQPASQTHCS